MPERAYLNVPLMVPTYLLHSDLRHQLDGSDTVGSSPIMETLRSEDFGVF